MCVCGISHTHASSLKLSKLIPFPLFLVTITISLPWKALSTSFPPIHLLFLNSSFATPPMHLASYHIVFRHLFLSFFTSSSFTVSSACFYPLELERRREV